MLNYFNYQTNYIKTGYEKFANFFLHYFQVRARPRYKFQRFVPSFDLFLLYGLENFEQKVRYLCLPSFRCRKPAAVYY